MVVATLAVLLGGCRSADGGWSSDARDHRGAVGETVVYTCEPGGRADAVWGTDVYTDDSSVCTAAVHAGLITFETGGDVEIEILAGQGSYCGSSHNGVTSRAWAAWYGSFRFPRARPWGDCEVTTCVPACGPGSTCVHLTDVDEHRCLDTCFSAAECTSGCCTGTSDGTSVCAPASYCGADAFCGGGSIGCGAWSCPVNGTCTPTGCGCAPSTQAVDCFGVPCDDGHCDGSTDFRCQATGPGPTCNGFDVRSAPFGPSPRYCGPPTVAVTEIMTEINAFWTSSMVSCQCGADAPQCVGNAFVDPSAPGYIYYDPNQLWRLHSAAGSSIGAAWFLAHEAGHNVQIQLGLRWSSDKGRELGADCLAGYFLAFEHCRGIYDMSEGMTAINAICVASDPVMYGWFEPNAHGTCSERTAAVERGVQSYFAGALPAVACTF